MGGPVKDVLKWAEKQLHGQTPRLSQKQLSEIAAGKIRRVILQAKKDGFFTASGEFVETFEIEADPGAEVEAGEFDAEAQLKSWIDEEHARFNKETQSDRWVWEAREHGRRIKEFAAESGIAIFTLQEALSKRAERRVAYTTQAHQMTVDLYEWKKHAEPTDPVFQWTWQLLDAALRLSKDNTTRDRAAGLANEQWFPAGVKRRVVAEFFRGPAKTKTVQRGIWAEQQATRLAELRPRILSGQASPTELEEVMELLAQFSRAGVPMREEGSEGFI